MPIRIDNELPAKQSLEIENIFVMSNKRADTQDIRPLIFFFFYLFFIHVFFNSYLFNDPLWVFFFINRMVAFYNFFKIFVFSTRTLASDRKICYKKTVANLQGSTKTVHMEDCRKE